MTGWVLMQFDNVNYHIALLALRAGNSSAREGALALCEAVDCILVISMTLDDKQLVTIQGPGEPVVFRHTTVANHARTILIHNK